MQSVAQPLPVVRPQQPAPETRGAGPTPAPVEPTWKRHLREAVRTPAELCDLLGLPESVRDAAERASRGFPLLVPRPFVARMRPGDATDPLLRQVLPIGDELVESPGFRSDPVGDLAAQLTPGVLQKYAGRVLLVTTGACAVHCRYCFRRHFPYSAAPKGIAAWEPAVKRIEADPTIDEAILSGGDPLSLVDGALAGLVERLERVPHLRRLRVHTRLPIVIPERVTDALVATLGGSRLTPVVVLHSNHPQELDASVAAATAKLSAARVLLLNQAVLLRGVNDSVETLAELSRRLIDLRVTPYYLHRLDRVAGAHHFATPDGLGETLVAALRELLPGYAVPRYVAEVEGAPSKTPLG
ncbi:MAG: EF-P beta-lysylation protein EpmB [Lacipirellulaceae bacterium]